MFAYLKGEMIKICPFFVVVEVGGVGYKVFVPPNYLTLLPKKGESVFLYTSFIVRDNSQSLYGFLNEKERDLFEEMIEVSGIGPKMALNLIGYLTLKDFCRAVQSHDAKVFSKVPGIGKKTAEKLVVAVKHKLEKSWPTFIESDGGGKSDFTSQNVEDAILALIHLGYNQMVAKKAVQKTVEEHSEHQDLSLLITRALKNI